MPKAAAPLVVLLLVIVAALLGDKPQPRADFSFINRGDVTTLDLALMSWQQDLRVARVLYEGLTKNDIFTWDYQNKPGVAERWEVSDDGRTYTFHLRDNAKWSNGEPVTAEDFRYSWRRCMLPDLAGDYAKLFTLIKGGDEFYHWRANALKEFAASRLAGKEREAAANALWEETLQRFDTTVQLRAPDSRTLVVELVRPTPHFLDLTSFAIFYPIYPPLVEAYQSIDPQTAYVKSNPDWTKPPHLISNGPFVLKTWRFKRDMRLERNPHWWNQEALSIESISIPTIEDPNAGVLAFKTGVVQWVSDVSAPYRGDMIAQRDQFFAEHADEVAKMRAEGLDPVEIARRLPRDPRAHIHTFDAFGTYFYNFNCLPMLKDGRKNPFADPRVRRAFTMAIDRGAIVDDVRRSGERVSQTLIPPNSIRGYTSPKGVPFDPAAARALLAEAGFPNGEGFITVEILFNKDSGHDLIAQAIARNWEQYLGVKVILQQKEIKVFREDVKEANYMVSRGSWFGDYGHPTTFLDLSRDGNGNNDRKYASPQFEALMDAADNEPDFQQSMDLYAQAERLLVDEDLPIAPIFQYVQIYLFDPHVLAGISSHPRQEQNMYEVDILGDGKGPDQPRPMKPISNQVPATDPPHD